METKKVVVNVSQNNFSRKDGKLFVARIEVLGLTAYGRTEGESTAELRKLFRVFINELRQRSQLESRLNQLGVDWYWAEDYPNDWAGVVDTTEKSSWTPISQQQAGMGYMPIAA